MPLIKTDPALVTPPPSFIGLQSYTEAQADKFFGRDKEIDTLTKLVESNTLTIVFGKSGTGKTSLLNAGVFPKLRKDYCLPFRIRLEFRDETPDLVTQIKHVLRREIDTYGFTVEAYPGTETLWEYFHREALWNTITPILVFDQFEEMFTLAKKNERFGIKEQEMFWEELADLIENSIPGKLSDQFLNNKEAVGYNYRKQKAKIVFAFREEFLPEFESITSKIPSIKFSRFRLLPMNGNQAYDVITKTWKADINESEARQIVSFFAFEADNESYDLLTVEPSLLSQVCSFIDKERISEGNKKVSAELLKKYPKDTILRTIYKEAIEESRQAIIPLAAASPAEPGNPVKEFIEEKMITSEGYRTKYHLGEKETAIRPGLEVLISKYLIREDDNKVELTHDILAPIVKTDREKRRKEAAISIERKKARRKAFIILLAAVLTGIGFWAYASYQRNQAIEERDTALNELNQAIKKNADLQTAILLAEEKLNSGGSNTTKRRIGDTDTASVATIPEEEPGDSLELASLRRSYGVIASQLNTRKERLNSMEEEMQQLLAQMNQAGSNFEESKARSGAEHLALRKRVTADSLSIISLKRELTALTIRFNNLHDLYESLMTTKYPPPPNIDTNFNLKLNLYYTGKKNTRIKAPGNLSIYLIPDIINNKKIIRQAKLFEIRCDLPALKKAQNFQIANYHNGKYGFAGLPAGKYFVKICDYYGGYYSFTKNAEGVQEIDWDAAPPIR
ncbi:MAG: hypothetical protein V4725_15130 [Bacteroidota bacterium]